MRGPFAFSMRNYLALSLFHMLQNTMRKNPITFGAFFNSIFTTQRLVRIALILAFTVAAAYLQVHHGGS